MMAAKQRRKKVNAEIGVQEARELFKSLLNRVQFGGERIVITRYGEAAAALVSVADLEKLEGAA